MFVIIYLDAILAYIKDLTRPDIEALQSMLENFWNHKYFANFKKC